MDKQSISGDWTGEISPKLSLGVSSYEAGDVEFDQIYARLIRHFIKQRVVGEIKFVCLVV